MCCLNKIHQFICYLYFNLQKETEKLAWRLQLLSFYGRHYICFRKHLNSTLNSIIVIIPNIMMAALLQRLTSTFSSSTFDCTFIGLNNYLSKVVMYPFSNDNMQKYQALQESSVYFSEMFSFSTPSNFKILQRKCLCVPAPFQNGQSQ